MSNQANRPSRKGRPNHPIDFKRRLAQQACEDGISVSRLAQEHGLNANLLFRWRRQYRAGRFDQSTAATALLPVSIVASAPSVAAVVPSMTEPMAQTWSPIEVVFADCTVRIGSAADMKTLRAVLALLRQ